MSEDKWFVDDIDCPIWADGFDSWPVPTGPFNGIRWWAENPDEDFQLYEEAMAEIDFITELVHEIERLQTENITYKDLMSDLASLEYIRAQNKELRLQLVDCQRELMENSEDMSEYGLHDD